MQVTIQVVINGEPREVPDSLNVVALLAHLGITAERVAIERNRDILPRANWQDTLVQPGDSYEIVHFVGGG
ncbi:MAG: sulfur carrier protein ThiS [Candidatus Acidiferrales bacterium]|jgi:thiamine biosynthesis protein ThiS|nr:sulfur carrier protein ThiS [Candidatus Acidoferrales bacterium]